MRLKSGIWVKAYLRRCSSQAVPAMIVRRGQGDAGAIFIKINRLDGTALVLGPAPAGFEETEAERRWSPCHDDEALAEAEAEAYLSRQVAFDSDIWIIEIEDRHGRHLLDDAIVDV